MSLPQTDSPDLPWHDLARGAGLMQDSGALRSTIFDETSVLARAHGAVNLGQGFPDADGPAAMIEAAAEALRSGLNQYSPERGLPELREAIAAQQLATQSRELDPQTQVVVTAGAAEALAAALLAILRPGDEVVVLEPHYDLYAAIVAFAGGVLRPVALRPPEFGVDLEDLRAAFSDRTAAVLVNDPHNPTGTVLSPETAREIARLAVEHDAVILTDEVYEHLRYDGAHLSLAAGASSSMLEPELAEQVRERTLVVSSASKSLQVTGWRIGWVSGPADLISGVSAVKTYLSHSAAAPLQKAVAAGLRDLQTWGQTLAAEQAQRSALVGQALRDLGLQVAQPSGSYYVVADFSPLFDRYGATTSAEMSRALIEQAGLALLPLSAFAAPENQELYAGWMRVAACKRESTLQEGMDRLAAALR
ncbi:aminotransferase class I/II-fold pyridoxal phosphate-dependent enzyme [Kocuria palustris]|jgi:N-succinyldiaminopimelate aminotransferase|uniref:aminotransferase class I/II-fold pyridoxal phosphate-dependent enzyme n=1 Tax=Kocuria palustris TaxID=71999 RepID=UPI0019D0F319|nr:aminotransferase class I/II-fold pyridoxal phosphate-dependent enzyme [Kocuria palustris]MBN6752234.1 aminotransferase class I/II-fold pyridoxal phosphate-dependent enzyme [Kocuria palustris]MBN6757189.1 aminotransferase class I/II-fold pyridoxal phosphate-dependent enzyme [Kocuria palustris]MBN6762217.1 aminotransferase class I/II-fold pyridoxal phosphate-dependent enzyme [Kocuria palustris]MBN6781699.1 aminotransferase class I/II-fold pyridoxal phosphate-dependent enzyme [Kocuria palustris